jgi:alpha-beta hydrolase superfamily lysophospholipase
MVTARFLLFTHTLLLIFAGMATAATAPEWQLQVFPHQLGSGKTVRVRAGYLPESPSVPFQGNILYFQGFADSMLNHDPLFGALAARGYRIVAFDYVGQGGSSGTMNASRIQEIPDLGDVAWQRFARPEPAHARRTILGWSTGGLAAYYAASRKRADVVILISPGLHLHALVGRMGQVTLETLTSRPPGTADDPHVDPIRPRSPFLVPRFALDLMKNSIASQSWTIDPAIRGLAILTGPLDRYVKAAPTEKTLRRSAPHFEIVSFPGSRHEVDNEVDSIRNGCVAAIVDFLQKSIVPR